MEIENLYGQFCPVSMASEVICTRWTPLVLRELLSGSSRFNEIRRGVPKMSPTLLSKRLKELEAAGVIETRATPDGHGEYCLTEAGEDLRPVIMGIGTWGQAWVESRLSLRNLDPSLLMWDIRRNFAPAPWPKDRCTVQFRYRHLREQLRDWWLVIGKDEIDLCRIDPGYDVDVMIDADLRSMTAVWMGFIPLPEAIATGQIRFDGSPRLARQVQSWLKLSVFAHEPRRVP